jgi:hypothetical protein
MTSWMQDVEATRKKPKRKLSRRLGLVDEYGLSGFGLIVVILMIACVIVAILVPSIIFGSRALNRSQCHNFATQSGYQTKFVILNWGSTGTCLAHVDGKWIPKENIRSFAK